MLKYFTINKRAFRETKIEFMIGMAESCIGGFALFNYVIDQNKGFELMRNNLCGESPLEIMQELKIIQKLNQKATNKLFSNKKVSLGFDNLESYAIGIQLLAADSKVRC